MEADPDKSSTDATPRPRKPSLSVRKRDEIPWPAITKLSPGKLTRTASTLMNEWEKSLRASVDDGALSGANDGLLTKEQKAD